MGGYAWIFLKGEVMGTTRPQGAKLLPGRATGRMSYLTRFIKADPRLEQGYPVTLVAGE